MRYTLALAAGLLIGAASQGAVLKTTLIDRHGHPIADVKAFLECRQNFFFSDATGVFLAYVDSDVVDCIVTVSHPDFSARNRLVTMDALAETTQCSIVMTANGEPEPVGPGPLGNRYSSVVSCCGLTGCRITPDNGFGSGLFSIDVSSSPECSSRVAMMIAMSASEREADGLEYGYDLSNVERITFKARSVGRSIGVRFFCLSEICDPCERSCPSIDTILSTEFATYKIDITRWNRERVVAILGFAVDHRTNAEDATVEILDLRLEFGVSERAQGK